VQNAKYQDAASIREPDRCRQEFSDEQVDQSSRNNKLVVTSNSSVTSDDWAIGQGTNHRLTR
jgi:hypothetical protein